MRDFTTADLSSLMGWDASPCVSVYLPTHRSGPDIAGDPIRLRNLLDEAAGLLAARGRVDGGDVLEPGRRLVDDDGFWLDQDNGLAIFMAPGKAEVLRLPATVTSTVVVDDVPQLRPLLDVAAREVGFGLLALSRSDVRYFVATPYEVEQRPLPEGMPRSLAEATRFEDPEKQLQSHAARRVGRGRVAAVFHGQGVPDEREEVRLDEFLRGVDRGVLAVADPAAPLVLAGVEEIVAAYRRVTTHPLVLDDAVAGNPDRTAPATLHQRAVPIVEDWYTARVEADAAVYLESSRRSASIGEVVVHALHGRVAILFVPAGWHLWGEVETDRAAVTLGEGPAPGFRDLPDLAAVAARRSGATVHVVDPAAVPGGGEIAAVLRY